jgi:hypothetical protein
MASPKVEVFFAYDSVTGLPKPGLVPTFSSYTTEAGVAIVPQPSITDVGGGAYEFTPVFADPAHGIIYQVATGASPGYWGRYMRPEDWNDDNSNVLASLIKAKTDNLPASPANEVTSTAIKAKTDLIGTASVASQSDVTTAVTASTISIKGAQDLSISNIAGGASYVQADDNLHAISQAVSGGGSNPWDDLLANHNLSGSFGAAIRLIQQAVAGDQKIVTTTARLQIIDTDGVSVLREFYLLDENNQPSVNNTKYRKKV